jgi:hypothetical protein
MTTLSRLYITFPALPIFGEVLFPHAETANWLIEALQHFIMVMSLIPQGITTKAFLQEVSGVYQFT